MLLFEMTRRNEAATAVRERDLQKTWRKRIRQDYMRLFRSELGKKIFGRSQRKVLAEVFKGWVRYWYWHLGHKEAFQLKYAVIKHGVDLRRLHPKILGMQLPGRVPRDDDVPTHYAFKVGSKLDRIAREYETLKKTDPAELQRPAPPPKPSAELTAAAMKVVAAQDAKGRWLEKGILKTDKSYSGRILNCRTFIRNVETLCRYLEATAKKKKP